MASVARYCCCGGGDPCEKCDDSTPDQYTVTLAGINLCTNCVPLSGTFADRKTSYASGKSSADLNTSHTLDSGGAGCFWSKTITDLIDTEDDPERRNGDTCTDFTAVTRDIVITLTLDGASGWRLRVRQSGGASPEVLIFWDIQPSVVLGGAYECAEVPSFVNDAGVVGDCGDEPTGLIDGIIGHVAAYGGTASVVVT